MWGNAKPITVLMADDDPEDCMMLKEVWEECQVANELRFVEDGEELLDYLRGRGRYSDPASAPRPDLILLDLNMPRKDGREALREIKADPHLRQIPIVVLTTSKAEEDIFHSYDLGGSGFITKPVTFEGLAEVIRTLDKYWFKVIALPGEKGFN